MGTFPSAGTVWDCQGIGRAFQIWDWNLFLTNWIKMLELLIIGGKNTSYKFVKHPHARPVG